MKLNFFLNNTFYESMRVDNLYSTYLLNKNNAPVNKTLHKQNIKKNRLY